MREKLRLLFEPIPENAPLFAESIVASCAEISGTALDYTPASLRSVDEIIQGFDRDGATTDDAAETLFSFGCYVGEVFVRHAGGRWIDTPAEYLSVLGWPIVVELPNRKVCNPIGKVFKRLRDGEANSLPYFYTAFTARASPDGDPSPKRQWWRRR